MSLHGSLGEFKPTKGDWSTYLARLNYYFEANDVQSPAKQRAILLSASGDEAFQLIRSLAAPRDPGDFTFKELAQKMTDHFNPKKSAAVRRYKFNTRVRQPGETVATYVAELKKLAERCGFTGEELSNMLCDRLICGISDLRMQRRLLAEPDVNYEKAFAILQAMESADLDTQDLQVPPSTAPTSNADVHRLPSERQRRQQKHSPTNPSPCYRCGGKHSASECRFRDVDCRYCGKKGHIARVCRSRLRAQANPRSQRKSQGTHHLAEPSEPPEPEQPPADYSMFQLSGNNDPLLVTMTVNDKELTMEIDTGASLSVISEATYLSTWPEDVRPTLKPSDTRLRTYSGETLTVCGAIDVPVVYNNQSKHLSMQVLKDKGPTLLGRDWLHHLKLDWQRLNTVRQHTDRRLQTILSEHAEVFKDELGAVREVKVQIHVKPNAQPHFCRPRPVPYSLRQKVESELQRLQDQGVIEPVPFSDWAAPIVPVLKRDSSVRICGDYKLTVNKEATPDVYPLPRVEDLLATLAEGESYSKLDLAHAYQQLLLEDNSKKYTTINTTRGLFQYNRLPFGISSAPAVFQRTMEGLLRGIPGVCVYIDDVLVTGKSTTDHLNNLQSVLTRMQSAGMRLKKEKCHFMLPEVEYLGYRLSSRGVQPSEGKIRAIKQAPTPSCLSQLKSFLGLVNFYGKFLPNLATTLAPLYKLLQKQSAWSWGPEQQHAFQTVKDQLSSSSVLAHYNPQHKLLLSCDASRYGIGAVLSHQLEDGTDKPIAFASRSLSDAEKRYSQLDKEGLAIVFVVTRFRQYLLGRHFTIYSDHKPLMHLFSESRGVPAVASARIQRWALTLSAYTYSISYRPGRNFSNADGLSRLPLPDKPSSVPLPGDMVLLLECLQVSPVSAAQIRNWTSQDPVPRFSTTYCRDGQHRWTTTYYPISVAGTNSVSRTGVYCGG